MDSDNTKPELLRKWVSQAARGLKAMHEKGYIHRDVTLSNVVVSGEEATVLDLECGRSTDGYFAPEGSRKGFNTIPEPMCIALACLCGAFKIGSRLVRS